MVLGFRQSDIDFPHGFGYLASQKEQRFSLGAMFSTHMFPGRAPENQVMMEIMVGGRHHPDYLNYSNEELIKKCYDDIKELITIRNLPQSTIYTSYPTKIRIPTIRDGPFNLSRI